MNQGKERAPMKNDAVSFGGFTEQAKAALKFAQEEAMRLGYSTIDPEHLLLGLLANSASRAAEILRASGCELENVRTAVEALMQPDEPSAVVASLSVRTKYIIKLTVIEAKRVRSSTLDTDLLLLGILCEEQGRAREVLNGLGISLDTARAEVKRTRGEQVIGTIPLSPSGAVQIDQERQKQALMLARSRGRINSIYVFSVFAALVLCVVMVIASPQILISIVRLIISVNEAPVLSWQPLAGWIPLLVLFYSIVASIFLAVLTLPLMWLSGVRLLQRYGVYKEKTGVWLKRSLTSSFFSFLPIWFFVELIALLMVVQSQIWWAWAALVQFLFSLTWSRFGLHWSLLLSKGKMRPVSEGEIVERLQMLLERLQLPPCPLFIIKVSHRTNSANAYFSGIGRGRRIRLTDTMVSNFTLDEIEVILAHELGHYVHRDIWTRLIMRGLTVLAVLYVAELYMNILSLPLAPFTPLVGYLLFAVGSLLFVGLVRSTFWYRRRQEYRADEFALQATGKVLAFKDAMIRLTNLGIQVVNDTRRRKNVTTHPTLAQRLQHADEFAAREAQAAMSVQRA
jgi:STE24 endopeptidase